MGRDVSAVTRLFLKPEGLDVFPSAGAGTLRMDGRHCRQNLWLPGGPPARDA